ncbi:hypothetical protein BFJ68_g17007 [Fusarium oxysporum]|uniref:Uncharacterized protein n=1 Tax=Fusarium oxysporum TaxID=5507 RepID=A0A420MAE1_FUSOX|nr:hypothetical protein BFJ67_g16916 [Fusarium oxysporum f. sp. cepae]RKK26747.1 hypothetical protein BFJ66_g16980 [Fusarium oxysporum f. sp. cepae]RKK64588.1 hypothetical protein BFJ69_g16704 [Fusarium oxysporum]RKK87867.1 hypothetical protein BFJ68_g17007 [Fusarium oxysporum]
MTVSEASGTQTGEGPNGVERVGLSVLDELLSSQGLPYSIHNSFALEAMDFWLTDSDTAAFPEAGREFDFPGFMAGPLPENEQGNHEQ